MTEDKVILLEDKFKKSQRYIPVSKRKEIIRRLENIKESITQVEFDLDPNLIENVELELEKYPVPSHSFFPTNIPWKTRLNLMFTHPVFWIVLIFSLILEFLLIKTI